MRINRDELDNYFVDKATFLSASNRRVVICSRAREAARHLINLRKISQLCGMYNEEALEFPKRWKDTKGVPRVEVGQCKNLPKLLLRLTLQDFKKIEEYYPKHRFCPYTEAIIEAVNKQSYFEVMEYWRTFGELAEEHKKKLKEMILDVKGVVAGNGFKKMMAQHERAANKNARSGNAYSGGLFDRHARMLIVRVDFHYLERFSRGKQGVSLEEARRHRTKLLRAMRYRKEFKHLVGMIWKVEYTPLKGYHIHGLFFFDGNKRKSWFSVCEGIKSFWEKEVVEEKGYAYVIDPSKHNYKYPFIGMVKYNEMDKRKGLEYAINYLTKVDYLARLNVPGRLYGKMVIKPVLGKKQGRPRGG